MLILPVTLGSGANYAKNLLRAAVLVQYIPRLYRFLPMLAGQSPSGFIFESAWANFIINLLTFVLAGHVVGSCWYLFGLQVCHNYYLPKNSSCQNFLSIWLKSFLDLCSLNWIANLWTCFLIRGLINVFEMLVIILN